MINATYHAITSIPELSIPTNMAFFKDGGPLITPEGNAAILMQELGLYQPEDAESNVVNWSNVLGCLSVLNIYPEWESKIDTNYKEKSYIPGLFPISLPASQNAYYTIIEPMDVDNIASQLNDSNAARALLQEASLEIEYLEADSKSEQIAIVLVALAKLNRS